MPKSEVFFVTAQLQQVLDDLPADEPRSRLEPFRPFILRWRRQGRSYRKILQILRNECNTKVAFETLRRFVMLRSRPRKAEPESELDDAATESVSQAADTVTPRMTAEERATLRASYEQPLFPSEEKKPLFVRRPGPTRNLNNEKLGEK